MKKVRGEKPEVRVCEDSVGFHDVTDRELDAIEQRRQRAFSNGSSDRSQLPSTLCGLALSGGGIRSAAMSLGFLKSLYRGGLLRYVDYMSSVSGGGYAAAYTSSKALAEADEEAESDSGRSHLTDRKPINEDERLDRRSLTFVYGGNYLRKTWIFFNRYLIGLLLVWTILLAGLIAVGAAIALLFRSLDYLVVRSALDSLGFEGDVRTALFPSFILLIVWLSAWAISYFKYNSRATGRVARVLFYVLVLVTLVAIASLIGTGDIGVPLVSDGSGNPLGKLILTMIVSAVVASLLPYLAPRKLLRERSPSGFHLL
jgi:patatin-like phospholipase